MFMIVMIHVLGYGGVRDTPVKLSAAYNTAWLMNTAAYCAVNCYAMISGYAGFHAQHRLSRLIALWFRVVLYTLTITAIFWVIFPGDVGLREWLKAVFPVMGRQYWYFTMYFGLFCFMPLLDAAVDSLSRWNMKYCLTGVLLVLSLLQTVFHRDRFGTDNGFSLLWLMVMYLLGAYFRKYDTLNGIKSSRAIAVYVLMVLCTWCSKLLIEVVTINLLGKARGGDLLTHYTSPTVIIEAVCLIAIFARMSLSVQAIKAVRLLAPLTFSIYLIHLHRLFLKFVIMDRFKGFILFSPVNIVLAVIIATTVIYLFCSVCDMVRAKLFCLLRIDYISELAEKFLGRTVKRLWIRIELLMFSASEKNLQEAGRN